MIVVVPRQLLLKANRFAIRLLPVLMVGLLAGCGESPESSPGESASAGSSSESALQAAAATPKDATPAAEAAEAAAAAPAEEAATAPNALPTTIPGTNPPTVPATEIVVAEPPASSAATAAKAKRDPIYDTETPGDQLIAAALKRAQRDHKHVLVEFGGNWCGWCFKLHDVFSKDQLVRPIVSEEFELVLVDEGTNRDLMHKYGGTDRQYSFPHLTILDSDGNVLTNQETGSLEEGPNHDPKLVAEFLNKWVPSKLDAEVVMTDALKTAAAENKHVLIRVGTPYCGWCKILAQFVQDHQPLIAADYVDVKIDTMRMVNGAQVAERYEPKGGGGVPWMVILNGSGEVVTTSVGPDGNIGYPYQPNEIAHFLTMLRDTRHNLTDADLATMEADLTRYRTEREQKPATN